MSFRGYRTREPVSLDFPNEETSIFDALLRNIQEDLQYSQEDIAQLLHLHFEELNQMYRLQKKPRLQAV
jgi:hypothetical protein